MGNDKDIKIDTEEYVILDDKLKPGERALGKKFEEAYTYGFRIERKKVVRY